ncbi:hypothetical protein BJ875DRAFT_14393 [Amylocarpus encephaloides]|uniref:Uncharacterized protein n=1 Tax=Amylocarpus encephaloides TaxID=45428 RepID=A0A9P8CB24_9HELO|nr:hypothetical protein BJ875DRAFT_14393 [Amylocarpus encephaloides]
MGKSIDGLQSEWKLLFQRTLPEAATSKAPSQIKWPMPVDHCFSRIILDLTVGVDTPWTNKIKSPAYKNMTKDQLEKRILMGNEILEGKVDLIELNEKSLVLRREAGRPKKRKSDHENSPANSSSKRKKSTRASKGETESEEGGSSAKDGHGEESPYFRQKLDRIKTEGVNPSISPNPRSNYQDDRTEDLTPYLKMIALSHKTPFQKKSSQPYAKFHRGSTRPTAQSPTIFRRRLEPWVMPSRTTPLHHRSLVIASSPVAAV